MAVDDDRVLEYYRRNLTSDLAGSSDRAEVLALRRLDAHSTLACWCVDRPAQRAVGLELELDHQCHGDVVFTVWSALERLDWRFEVVDRRGRTIVWDPLAELVHPRTPDLDAHNAVWSALYLEAFGAPMVWGSR